MYRLPDYLPSFPTVLWKREAATFFSEGTLNEAATNGLPSPAALVFPFYGDRIVLADIAQRGWCIPSGHLEAGESEESAIRREAYEEAGVTLGAVYRIGHFLLTDTGTKEARLAPTFIASVTGIGEIPPGSESRGMQLVAQEEVASMYFAWDDLLSDVFAYACQLKNERLRSGSSLSLWTENDEGQ